MRIVYAGTPDFAASSLQRLLDDGHQIIAVYTQPDRPAGRGRKLQPSPVKQVALDAGLPVYQPLSLRDADAQTELRALQPDLMIVAAYGLILPQAVLDIPARGCLNIHASLLPRWRGAAPIQRALAAGDTQTGITIMQRDGGLDTGAMLLKLTTPILNDDTGGTLHDRLAALGADAISQAVRELDNLVAEPQDTALATYAHKLSKDDVHLDWTLSAQALERQIRAFNPWPVCWCDDGEERIRVLQARIEPGESDALPGSILARERDGIRVRCADGILCLTEIQLAGSRPMTVSDLINGGKAVLAAGHRLS
ncbi:MAG: methionyl-tRNA formyltransferase [Gammaproteobacteria bacterium]|nr:methionyl-tRNA formyltransferase [Gammaproteobacteria bacterium]